MSKYRRILLAITKGGISQSEIAASLHVSKRDVSAAAKVARERGLTFEQVGSMDEGAVTDTFFPEGGTQSQSLVPAARHGGPRREEEEEPEAPGQAPVAEHCDEVAERRKLSYSYQAFCEMLAAEAERLGATRHFEHEPSAKCYVDWAGDPAWLTDMMAGAKAKVWLLVVVLPFSDRFWAEGVPGHEAGILAARTGTRLRGLRWGPARDRAGQLGDGDGPQRHLRHAPEQGS